MNLTYGWACVNCVRESIFCCVLVSVYVHASVFESMCVRVEGAGFYFGVLWEVMRVFFKGLSPILGYFDGASVFASMCTRVSMCLCVNGA